MLFSVYSNRRLSQIWQLIQGLERDGVPPDSQAYDILEKKAIFWIARLEILSAMDPGNRHSLTTSEISRN